MALKITLKEWREIESHFTMIKKLIEETDSMTWKIFDKYHRVSKAPDDTPEAALLFQINQRIHELREQAGLLPDVHPQSEWMGGNSDNPKNHKLREPNCCPMPRRHFTPEEVKAAKAICHGPCDWTYAKDTNEELAQ